MSGSNANPNNTPSGDIASWVVVFICLIAFWPLGLILLLRKISFGAKNGNNQQTRPSAGYYQSQSAPGRHAQTGHTAAGSRQQPAAPPQPARTTGPVTPYRSFQSAISSTVRASYTNQTPTQAASQTYSAAGSKPGKTREKAADKKQNPAKSLAVALTALAVVLGILGVVFLSSGLGAIAAAGLSAANLGMSIFGAFSLIGASISALLRGGVLRRIRRFNKYAAVIGDRDVVPMSELARAVSEPVKKTRKWLEDMLDSGYYGEAAYIDGGLDSFVRTREAADKVRGAAGAGSSTEDTVKQGGSENQYVAIVNELHMLCSQTSDPVICGKIERIEGLTVKIFRIVEEKPEKATQNRRFMNYYLPTTLKLLHSYQTLERQGIDGENITSAKQDIERILDTLASGFEQQVDNLFKSEKLDISADIDVIENLMEQDGLKGDGGIMKTAGGH